MKWAKVNNDAELHRPVHVLGSPSSLCRWSSGSAVLGCGSHIGHIDDEIAFRLEFKRYNSNLFSHLSLPQHGNPPPCECSELDQRCGLLAALETFIPLMRLVVTEKLRNLWHQCKHSLQFEGLHETSFFLGQRHDGIHIMQSNSKIVTNEKHLSAYGSV